MMLQMLAHLFDKVTRPPRPPRIRVAREARLVWRRELPVRARLDLEPDRLTPTPPQDDEAA